MDFAKHDHLIITKARDWSNYFPVLNDYHLVVFGLSTSYMHAAVSAKVVETLARCPNLPHRFCRLKKHALKLFKRRLMGFRRDLGILSHCRIYLF